MLTNINTKQIKSDISEAAMNVGVIAMSAAMVLAVAEHTGVRHPALATANAEVKPVGGEHTGNDMRSQREDAGPHRVDFGVPRNTPPRSGRA